MSYFDDLIWGYEYQILDIIGKFDDFATKSTYIKGAADRNENSVTELHKSIIFLILVIKFPNYEIVINVS